MKTNPLVALGRAGQSPWIDYIHRGMIASGELARRIAPPGFLIGASVGSEMEAAAAAAADYWGIGPWRITGTKQDAGSALGADGFARLAGLAGGRPCIAIGGVRPEDAPGVRAAGGAGIAVVSGILGADDVETATRRYARALAP